MQWLWQVAFSLPVDFKSVSVDVCCKIMSAFQTYLSLLVYKNDRNYVTNTSNSMVTAALVLCQIRLHVKPCIYQSINRNTIVNTFCVRVRVCVCACVRAHVMCARVCACVCARACARAAEWVSLSSLCSNNVFCSTVSILVTKCCLYDNWPPAYYGCNSTRQLLNTGYCFQIKGSIVNCQEILYILLCRKPGFKCSLGCALFILFIYLHIPLLHYVPYNKMKWNEYFSKKGNNFDTNCMMMILCRGCYVV